MLAECVVDVNSIPAVAGPVPCRPALIAPALTPLAPLSAPHTDGCPRRTRRAPPARPTTEGSADSIEVGVPRSPVERRGSQGRRADDPEEQARRVSPRAHHLRSARDPLLSAALARRLRLNPPRPQKSASVARARMLSGVRNALSRGVPDGGVVSSPAASPGTAARGARAPQALRSAA